MKLYEMEIVQYGVFDSRVKFPKAFVTPQRTVVDFELEIYTEDQTGICYLNNMPIPLKKGTVICAKPGQLRSSKLHFRCINFHLAVKDPQIMDTLRQIPNYTVLSDIRELSALFHRILGLDLKNFPEQKALLYSYTYQFLHLLISETRSPTADSAHYPHRRTMQQTEAYIREHLDEVLDLQTLASRANLSPVYFHKLFSAHAGMTPAAFVLNCRIAEARALLKAGKMSISDIACRCGFASQSYFNYKFKEVTGESPLQYRKARLSRLEL